MRSPQARRVALVVAVAVAFAVTPAAQSVAAAKPNRADIEFARQMRSHHLLGVEMGRPAQTKSQRSQTKALADNVVAEQRRPAAELTRFLRANHKTLKARMSPVRENANQDSLRMLREAPAGLESERQWLMIFQMHHFDAIDLARRERPGGRDAAMRRLARPIIVAQTREAANMERLQGLLGDPTPLSQGRGAPAPPLTDS